MGLIEFSKLPVNTLVGAKWNTFNRVSKNQPIDSDYKGKFYLTKSICRLLSLLQPLEDAKLRKLTGEIGRAACRERVSTPV